MCRTSPFHQFAHPHVINLFIFGQGVVFFLQYIGLVDINFKEKYFKLHGARLSIVN